MELEHYKRSKFWRALFTKGGSMSLTKSCIEHLFEHAALEHVEFHAGSKDFHFILEKSSLKEETDQRPNSVYGTVKEAPETDKLF